MASCPLHVCVCVYACTLVCGQVQYGEVRGQLGGSPFFASTLSVLGMALRLLAPEPLCPLPPQPSALTSILKHLPCALPVEAPCVRSPKYPASLARPPMVVLPVSPSCAQSLARKWKIPSCLSDARAPCEGHLGPGIDAPVG